MTWFELTLVYVGFMVAAAILNKKTLSSEGIDELVFGGSVQLMTGLISLVLALREGFVFNFNFSSGLLIMGMMITYLFAVSLYFTGLKYIDLSQETILSATGSIWSLFLGAFLLSENITTVKFIGVLLIIIACLVLVWEKKMLQIGKYQGVIIISAFFYALGAVWDKQLNNFGTPLSYLSISFISVGLLMLFFYFKRTISALDNSFQKIDFWKGVILNGILYSFSFWALFSAYQIGGEVSRMFPMTLSTSILVPILGMILLKEHQRWLNKSLAIIILIFGLWFLKG